MSAALPSPQLIEVVKSEVGAPWLASVKVAFPNVETVTPSMPPVAVAALLPVRSASATVAEPVMVVMLPPSSAMAIEML